VDIFVQDDVVHKKDHIIGCKRLAVGPTMTFTQGVGNLGIVIVPVADRQRPFFRSLH
jgi:hypothetical protein